MPCVWRGVAYTHGTAAAAIVFVCESVIVFVWRLLFPHFLVAAAHRFVGWERTFRGGPWRSNKRPFGKRVSALDALAFLREKMVGSVAAKVSP